MEISVIKKDGSKVKYRPYVINRHIEKSVKGVINNRYGGNIGYAPEDVQMLNLFPNLISRMISRLLEGTSEITIKDLNNLVEEKLKEVSPIVYNYYKSEQDRKERKHIISSGISEIVNNISVETTRDNANVGNNFSAKMLQGGSEVFKWNNLARISKSDSDAHKNGDVYIHDLDSYYLTANCLHIRTGEVLAKGFNTGYGFIKRPNRIESAAALSCILLQSSQNDMFGGQSHVNFDNDLAPYIESTRKGHAFHVMVESVLSQLNDEDVDLISGYISYVSDSLEDMLGQDSEKQKVLFKRSINQYATEYNKDSASRVEKLVLDIISNVHEKLNKYDNYLDALTQAEKLIVQNRTLASVHQAMQAVVYNLNTMHSRAGSQVPFSSVNIGLPDSEDAALLCKVFLEEYNKGLGKSEQPIFPNIIFRVKSGVNRNPEDKYYYLYKLACKVAAKRMNPTFMNIDSSFNEPWYKKGIYPALMGCRTYLCSDINGHPGPGGRGNNAPVTINLPRLGIQSKQAFPDDQEQRIQFFFKLLDRRLKTCKHVNMNRFRTLKRLRVKDLPFVAGQGLMVGSEGLGPDDSITPILIHGTWGIGFIGLAETLVSLVGSHQGETEEARELGVDIVSYIRQYCNDLILETQLNWACYATPAEGLSGKFIKQDKEKYGIIPGVTDKDYYTNSFHVPVSYKISPLEKLKIEAPYHNLCNGGHISYVELDGEASGDTIEKIVTNAFKENKDLGYIATNFHIRHCKKCGTSLMGSDQQCPNCGSREIQGISRVTGYMSLDERFGDGKRAERADRVAHDTGNKVYTNVD